MAPERHQQKAPNTWSINSYGVRAQGPKIFNLFDQRNATIAGQIQEEAQRQPWS